VLADLSHTALRSPRYSEVSSWLGYARCSLRESRTCPIPDSRCLRPALAGCQQLNRQEAYSKFKEENGGKNAQYIPYLASVPSHLFGVVIATTDGQIFAAGDVDYGFAIESVSKPFTMCLVMQEQGEQVIIEKIGVEPTGLPTRPDRVFPRLTIGSLMVRT
jgi:Glutaminase